MAEAEIPILWLIGRASGIVSLIALTVTVLLGIAAGSRSSALPRFVTQGLHRAAAGTGLALLAVHIASVVVDPFVALTWLDVVVPFAAGYARIWTGLGTLAVDIMLLVVITSLLRRRLSPRGWWIVHVTAYAAYGLTVAHALGAGTDAGAPLFVAMTVASVSMVVVAVALRLARARKPDDAPYDAELGPRTGAPL
jgi:hypothetical protein